MTVWVVDVPKLSAIGKKERDGFNMRRMTPAILPQIRVQNLTGP
jgi:hypothetical protein